MHRAGTAFLITSIISIAIFGFFAMGHGADHGGCIAKTLQGRACTSTDIFGVASYHLSAFQKAARAITSGAGLFAAFAIAVLAVISLKIHKSISALSLPAKQFTPVFIRSSRVPEEFLLRQWFSLKENSPNFNFGAALN